MRVLLVTALSLLSAYPTQAQFRLWDRPDAGVTEPCRVADDVRPTIDRVTSDPRWNGRRFSVGSDTDSQGRCTLRARPRAFSDALYGPRPDPAPDVRAAALAGGTHVADRPAPGYTRYSVADHLGLRVGYVYFNGRTQAYLYFDRYGALSHVADHVARDQWALYEVVGLEPGKPESIQYRYAGAVYAADPPKQGRWDERLIILYPFVYNSPYG